MSTFQDASSNINRQVTLQAVDKKGRAVNVVVMPSSINVEVTITKQGDDDQISSSSSSDSESSNDKVDSSSIESSNSSNSSSSSSH